MLLTVRLCPPGVTTWIGGTSTHLHLFAGASPPPAAPAGTALAPVDQDVCRGEFRAALAAMPADHRLDPGHQLFQRERLGDVIVRAQLQARDPVADRGAGADANERGVRLGAEGLEQLGTLVVGQHEVEQDDVWVPLPDELQPASRGLNRPDCVTLLSQPGSNRPREATVVFHQGNFPLNGHADGILPWNLRRSRRLGVTAEIQGPFLNKVCEAR